MAEDEFAVSEQGASLPLRRGLFIHWTRECFRSEATARMLNIPLHYVWPYSGSGKAHLALRYLRSFVQTVDAVRRTRPDHVVVHNQPVFIAMAVLLARTFNRHVLIFDFHSGALTHPAWKRFLVFYKWAVARSPFTFCHNRQDAAVLESWGGRPVLLPVLPQTFKAVGRHEAPERPHMLVVCSFRSDEPIDIFLGAMARCPDVEFSVTGNYARAGLDPAQMPPNVTLLGFVPYATYLERFARSTAVITISTRTHIMQMAVEEAISLGVPVITNESETLRDALEEAGLFCDITVDGLTDAINRTVSEARSLRIAARTLKQRRLEDAQAVLDRLGHDLPTHFETAPVPASVSGGVVA